MVYGDLNIVFHIPLTKYYLPKKESPDVETPGLLVKALISSYFSKIN
jgi:hypothetical protein